MDMFATIRKFAGVAGCIILTGLLWTTSPAHAQYDFEEVVVNFDVPRLVNTDIFVQYDGSTIYLPVIEIFNLLELNTNHSPVARKIYGHFIDKDKEYDIDIEHAKVTSFMGEFDLPRDAYLYEGHEFYLRVDLFKPFFDLEPKFDFSQLKVSIPLNRDFPAFQRMERRKAQEKLLSTRDDEKKLYPLPFKRAWFEGGVADWMVATNPVGRRKIHYFSLSTGNMLLGGDLSVTGTGNTLNGFDAEDIRYLWHYYVDDNKYISQVEAGKVYAGGRLPRGLDGVYATNKPQIRRKFFQTINLHDFVGQDWEVELYIDNRLTDFMRADAQGEYNFNVDIHYGASMITLKKYGPNGEIRIEEQNVKVPYNLIPKKEVEYTVAIGQDKNPYNGGYYAQANCYYGITSRFTMGVNVDAPISADSSDGVMAAADLSLQPLTNLTINGYAAPNHALNAGINFSQPYVINFNGSFTHYLANGFRNLAERKNTINLSMSSPLKIGQKRLSLRLNTFIDMFEKSTDINTYYGFSTNISRFYVNYFGKYGISNYHDNRPTITSISSQVLLSASIFRWIRPQFSVDYNHSENEIIKFGIALTKRVFKTGQLSMSFERNEQAKTTLMMATITMYTDFATFSTRAQKSGDQTALTQTQRGSVRYNKELNTVHFDRRAGVGQGSAVLRPFVDNNFNGVYDEGDRVVEGLTAKVKGANGRLTNDGKVFYFDRLRAYDEYTIEINNYSLDNPLLKPVHEGYRMNFNPNMVTSINVPIVMAGEVSGLITRKSAKGTSGQGGAKIVFLNLTNGTKTEVMTFNNGEFYYLGLIPGHYRAQLDKSQLDNYGYRSYPEYIDFEIENDPDGAIVEDIDFMLIPR
ncbi:MAG: hypothetical protein R3F48_07120 [Candidatus Zixiibacteriota bacterium]